MQPYELSNVRFGNVNDDSPTALARGSLVFLISDLFGTTGSTTSESDLTQFDAKS